MRAISLVEKLEFNFTGNVARNALTLGDIDNDGCIELIIGNNKGEFSVFKGNEKVHTVTNLTFISCIAVGDVMNKKTNCLVVITADGWCFIYEVPLKDSKIVVEKNDSVDETDTQGTQSENLESSGDSTTNRKATSKEKLHLNCIHTQRIPANAKCIVLGDIDGDGCIEMILGLTDRVVRSYRWYDSADTVRDVPLENRHTGKLVALNKWECAKQIGSITLHHSVDGKPSLLVAQPGGTFMRIRCCLLDDSQQNSNLSSSSQNSDNVASETMPGSSVDYQFLGISRMRNQNISTEILGDFQSEHDEKRPYAVATLDGTIMLVQDEVILWAIAVDHQVFALTKMDVNRNGTDDIVVCCWDGQTYILDQEKNSVRFHLDEPVQAFHTGYYNVSPTRSAVPCLVYITFKNKVIIYHDIPLTEFTIKKFEPDLERLSSVFVKDGRTAEEAFEIVKNLSQSSRNQLIEYLLYDVKIT